jgi:hypothetical protein
MRNLLETIFLSVLIGLAIGTPAPAQEPHFGERVDRGRIEHPQLDEASGIAASRKNPGVLWSHNDSGDANRIFALNENGQHLGIFTIVGATSRDWEDIAVGPGPADGESYLYIGDIGDNESHFDLKYIYRIPEPRVDASGAPVDSALAGVETIAFRYPDGNRDAETLMVDPLTKDIYIVSKRETNVRVYRAAYPQSTTSVNILEHIASLNFTLAVAGDISADGLEILIKTYANIYYWPRTPTQDVPQALAEPPLAVPYEPEPQGEAVCWQADGGGYYTVSEEFAGVAAHLYFYPRLDPTAVDQSDFTPPVFHLEQNYPNPFPQIGSAFMDDPATVIRYSLSQPGQVRLNIYDTRGRRVETLMDNFRFPGQYVVEYRPLGLASGVYFYRLQVGTARGTFSKSRKLIFVK